MNRDALLRTLAFHRTWGHLPTLAEWSLTRDVLPTQIPSPEDASPCGEVERLMSVPSVVSCHGRYAPAEDGGVSVGRQREDEAWAPRKRRAARRAAALLARLGSVRFVALCNTAALGHARDGSDLDLFVVTRARTVFATRLLAAALFEALGRRPRPGHERDAVCLSYFVADEALDLSSHMLPDGDPYFRHWFLSMVPLYDDGIGEALWRANAAVTSRHPFARPWIPPPDLRVPSPRLRVPIPRFLEPAATSLSLRAFPERIRRMMNADTRVMVTPTVLKFHVDDRRGTFRATYAEACRRFAISP
ncbi:hypothetical protein L0Y59_02365 [Candidatus Uhrbacteria bacterium]|nr:hypothetical protein [Candidatus Uhrbacteria bacterium]